MGTFDGQVAVVTGASGGIGKAIALGLAEQGAALCIVGRQLERLEEVAACARARTSRVLSYRADLSLDQDIAKLNTDLRRDCGQLDILVHSAGIIFLGPLGQAPVEEFDKQYRVNLRAPYALTRALLPMIRSARGQIVFINSTVGLATRANVAQFSATQHGLKAMADCLRRMKGNLAAEPRDSEAVRNPRAASR